MLSKQPASLSQPQPIESPDQQNVKLKILLVDDHAIVRVGLRQMLLDAFHQLDVTEAVSGLSPAEAIERRRFPRYSRTAGIS